VFVNPTSEKQRKKQNLDKLHAALLDLVKKDTLLKVKNVDLPKGKNDSVSLLSLMNEAKSQGKNGDVFVFSEVGAEDALAKNRATGKIVVAKAFVYKANISSGYQYDAKEA